ncbi:MAG: hypothetical protein JO268_06370 [Pseudonocardiales bacterium]|nr:hypothetical protein [Pseudonocardiales bacterium]
MATRPPRPESALSARTVEWLDGCPPIERRFVYSVWDRLAELERFGCPTGPIDALRSILLDHQPATRSGRCHGCRRLTWRHRLVWRHHLIPVPWCRHFPCLVWSRIGIELLEHPAERGRHRRTADDDRRRARSPPGRAGATTRPSPNQAGRLPRRTEVDPWRAGTAGAGASPSGAAAKAARRVTGRDHA